MMPPNSFHHVVAADDLPARKVPSELGSAPLPPGAELEADLEYYEKFGAAFRRHGHFIEGLKFAIKAAWTGYKISKRRAPGGNEKLSEHGRDAVPGKEQA